MPRNRWSTPYAAVTHVLFSASACSSHYWLFLTTDAFLVLCVSNSSGVLLGAFSVFRACGLQL